MKLKLIISALCLTASACFMDAEEFKTANIFSSDMVLQQESDVKIWGSGKPGTRIEIRTTWEKKKISGKVGANGKWEIYVRTPEASYAPQTVDISCGNERISLENIRIGEVWLCSGQSNMEMIMKPDSVWRLHVENAEEEIAAADFPEIRYINVFRNESYDTVEDISSNGWHVCSPESVIWLSAAGYYFARTLQEALDVPVGLLVDVYGGSPIQSWLPEETANDDFYAGERERLQKHIATGAKKPEYDMISSLYNGMLNPVVGFKVKGFLWYQGCSNVSDAARYPRMMKDLVSSWRKDWQEDLPFYHVQIAPFVYPNYQLGRWPELAWAQYKVTKEIGNSGLVITADIGDPANIHPGKKRPVGERLAKLALARTYGMDIKCLSPEVKSSFHCEEGTVIELDHAFDGLKAGSEENEFEVSEDGVLYTRPDWRIEGNRIVLSSPVDRINYVRYCWRDNSRSNIFNSEGLPLGPFSIKVCE